MHAFLHTDQPINAKIEVILTWYFLKLLQIQT